MSKAKTKTKAKKQTGDRVSKIAARVMREWERQSNYEFWPAKKSEQSSVTWSDVLALAASCLAQDETRGKRK